jgi:hypothetical protein
MATEERAAARHYDPALGQLASADMIADGPDANDGHARIDVDNGDVIVSAQRAADW